MLAPVRRRRGPPAVEVLPTVRTAESIARSFPHSLRAHCRARARPSRCSGAAPARGASPARGERPWNARVPQPLDRPPRDSPGSGAGRGSFRPGDRPQPVRGEPSPSSRPSASSRPARLDIVWRATAACDAPDAEALLGLAPASRRRVPASPLKLVIAREAADPSPRDGCPRVSVLERLVEHRQPRTPGRGPDTLASTWVLEGRIETADKETGA